MKEKQKEDAKKALNELIALLQVHHTPGLPYDQMNACLRRIEFYIRS
jgi:hypothetical protein